MKSNFQKIAVLCTCTGLLCSCGQSDNKQEHHKEFIPITILHPTTIEKLSPKWKVLFKKYM